MEEYGSCFGGPFGIKKMIERKRGVLSKLSFYLHNIDVSEGGGFACPHEKGKKSASEFKLDSNASCLTFLERFRRYFWS